MRRNMPMQKRALIVLLSPLFLLAWIVDEVRCWKEPQSNRQVTRSPGVRYDGLKVGVAWLEEDAHAHAPNRGAHGC
jgi:hypothetical protein